MITFIMIVIAIAMFIIAYAMGYKHAYNACKHELQNAAETLDRTSQTLLTCRGLLHKMKLGYTAIATAIDRGADHNELSNLVEETSRDLGPKVAERHSGTS